MRFWTSTVENKSAAASCRAASGSGPLLRRAEPGLMRLILSVPIRGFFRFFRRAKGFLDTLRRRWLRLSRCADDCRLPPLRFECLAKMVRLRIGLRRSTFRAAIDRQLIVGRAGGLRKLVELFLQVKDLFLQIYYVSGRDVRLSH
jgi:hypothetical protein